MSETVEIGRKGSLLCSRPLILQNKVMNYDWGSRGPDAFIPRLLGFPGEPNTPYAELWVGVHPSAPSDILVGGESIPLLDLIQEYPAEVLGKRVLGSFGKTLPFLFKVLSADEALSIQAHPNKEQAQVLHSRDPQNYPDSNHKPEIAIALDRLTALVGFKPFDSLRRTLVDHPELSEFIGMRAGAGQWDVDGPEPGVNSRKTVLKKVYSTLLKRAEAEPDELGAVLNRLEKRLSALEKPLQLEQKLFLELKRKHGSDVGLFSLFLFNLIQLDAGEGVYIDAGVPHAYLKGNLVECMANSDNVVRAGFTSKHKDLGVLIEILKYDMGSLERLGDSSGKKGVDFRTSAAEFVLSRFQLEAGETVSFSSRDSLSIFFVIEGSISIIWGREGEVQEIALKPGQSCLVPAAIQSYVVTPSDRCLYFKASVP